MKETTSVALFSFFGLVLFTSCKREVKTQAPTPTPALQCEWVIFKKQYCIDRDSQRCASLSIQYPRFYGGDSTFARGINDSLYSYILNTTLGEGREAPRRAPLDTIYGRFVSDFLAFSEEFPEAGPSWTIDIDARTPLLDQHFMTLELIDYTYTGGAHPNGFTGLTTYDLHSGKALSITDITPDTLALLPLLEKAFRAEKGMKESDPLSEVLYPEIQRFPLPTQFGLLKEGLRFYYNAYEIAPYAAGPTDILLRWDELKGIADQKKWQ